MADEETLSKIDLLPRANGAGAPLTWRIYVYGKDATPVDLTTLTSSNVESSLSTATLGEATLSGTWADDATLKTATFSSPVKGRYILFVADDRHKTDAKWLCVAEFNAYKSVASITYSVSGGSVVYDGTTYADGATITLSDNIDQNKLSAVEQAGKDAFVTVSGTAITVAYYKQYAVAGKKYMLKHKTCNGYVDIATLTSGNISVTADPSVVYFTHKSNGNWTINAAADNTGKYVGEDWYWNCKQSDTEIEWTIEETATEGEYRIKTGRTIYTGSYGYLATDGITCPQALWSDKAVDNANGIFLIEEYDLTAFESALSSAISAAEALIGTNPGYYKSADLTPLITAANKALTDAGRTIASLTKAKSDLEDGIAGLTPIMPVAGKIYQIVSALPGYEAQQGVKKAIYANGDKLGWKNLDDNDATMFWTLTPVEGGYAMKNNFTSKYAGVQATQSSAYPTSADATVLELTALGQGQFNLKTTGSGYAMHTEGHSAGAGKSGNIVAWNAGAGSASAWYIVETTVDEAAVAKATFATIQGYTAFVIADDETLVKADEVGSIESLNAAINAVNAINVATATVAEMGACYAENAATINSMKAYGNGLTDIVITIQPGYNTVCLPCWGFKKGDDIIPYTTSALDGTSVTLTDVSGSLKFNTPGIVENTGAAAVKYHFVGWDYAVKGQTLYNNGLLYGTIKEGGEMVPTGSYILSKKDDKFGFFKVAEGANYTCQQYKAYLTTTSGVKALYFDNNGEETAITDLQFDNVQGTIGNGKFLENGTIVIVKNGKKYNVAGQRVEN